MIHIALCLLAAALSIRTPGVRVVAILYAIIQGAFWALREPAKEYGQDWYLIAAAVELLTVLAIFRNKSDPAAFVRWVSVAAAGMNLVTYRYAYHLHDSYPYFIVCSEYARVACIITFSNPIWSPLLGWYSRRQAKKDTTWLANWTLVPR